ncbi:uncharacterized protein PV09_09023 [Verruconis gallopava]|uniref:Uncharacterized protein n=1 Tax=Verruconis gallopava TaxID=253628 RepID=A0A0D1ZXR7_9PEZI|nr:uncharacterized protein PV09_09023 [Verruconis gallopava]KIV99252.1 hypothetical protein PV09_09023 [Verruconis gallopava]
MFLDRISFHTSIAVMATMNAFFFNYESLPMQISHHLSQAVRLVNEQVKSLEFTDSTLSVVNFLIVQGLVQEDLERAAIHREGLQRIVEVLGGLSKLKLHPTLLLKIHKTDIDLSLHDGSPTHFYRDKMAEIKTTLRERGYVLADKSVPFTTSLSTTAPELAGILQDTICITALFNDKDVDFKVDPHTLAEITVSIGYRLLKFRTLNDTRQDNALEAAFHIGIATFLSTLYIQFGNRRFLKYHLVGTRLCEVIENGLGKENASVMLWLVFLGGISVLSNVDRDWLTRTVHVVTQALRITTWEEIQDHLLGYPWVSELHDKPGMAVWKSIADLS